jgi:predicted transglutaminase-like cysteine proteinase
MRIFSKDGATASFSGRDARNIFSAFIVGGTVICCSLPAMGTAEIGIGQTSPDGMFTTTGENLYQAAPFKVETADLDAYPLKAPVAPVAADPVKLPPVAVPKPVPKHKTFVSFMAIADPQIFGTVSIAVSHLAIENRWRSIAPIAPKALFGATCKGRELCDSPLMHAWLRLRSSLSGPNISPLDILHRVNAEVNAGIRYRSDTDNYGVPDYWASPAEVARRNSADCKEFALVKMWMLAALGVPNASMRIVVVKDMQSGAGHAILSVRLGGANLVLDNLTNRVRNDRSIGWYQPLYSVSTNGSWIHGVRRATTLSQAESAAEVADADASDSALSD